MANARHTRRWRRFFLARLDLTAYLGLHVTVGLLVVVGGVALFSAILEELLESAKLVRWDAAQSASMHARATPEGLALFSWITHLGSPALLSVIGAAVVAILWRRRRVLALACGAAWIGEALLNETIKQLVHRARPVYGTQYLVRESYSFPSGHAMGATVAYGMLCYLLVRHRGSSRTLAWFTVAATAVVIGVVAFSRVYLGVHYPTDVVGGVAAGAAWLAVCATGVEVALGDSPNGALEQRSASDSDV